MHRTQRILIGLSTLALLVQTARADDFTPPKDGKLTEKQVANTIAALKDQMAAAQAAGQAAQGTSGTAAMAIAANASRKIDAAITAHDLTKAEYEWVSGQISKVYGVAALQQEWDDHGKPDMEKQIKTHQDDLAAHQAKLAAYEKAQKDGTRVLTQEQRDAAINTATSDRDSIATEVKSDDDAIKPIQDEIAQHDKEAADADALAKAPPADVAADDRASYIDGKKSDAQNARDAAKEARSRLVEAQKSLTDAKSRLAAANDRIAHPETPGTDDEKASVKTENEQAITDTKAAINADNQAISLLNDSLAAGPMQLFTDPKDKPDPDNVALVKKHLKEYTTALTGKEQK